jgi:hypothetical protein
MIIKTVLIIISFAAIYHTATFAAWLYQNGNKSGGVVVYAIVLLALILLVI